LTVDYLQKAVSPGQLLEYAANASDRVAGFVLRAADAAAAKTPEMLYQAHGLGFAGSPWRPDAEFIDVLRFPVPLKNYLHDAMAPGVVDRPPFTGTGFAHWAGGQAPLFLLDEVRLPAGSELWRVDAAGAEELLAVYADVGYGWTVVVEGLGDGARPVPPSFLVGWRATWRGIEFSADLLDEGRKVVLASAGEPPAGYDGFVRTARGVWRTEVPMAEISDVYELYVSCLYQGLEFRVMDVAADAGDRVFRLSYVGHDADFAEGIGLNKADAGVYWTLAREADVQDLKVVQNRLAGMPNAE
jgi:hypothetical protein